jgi:hypothetical protein
VKGCWTGPYARRQEEVPASEDGMTEEAAAAREEASAEAEADAAADAAVGVEAEVEAEATVAAEVAIAAEVGGDVDARLEGARGPPDGGEGPSPPRRSHAATRRPSATSDRFTAP